MRLATEKDFYGGIYTHYRHHDGYAKRAQLLKGFPEPLLVIGCGFGFLIDELKKVGKRAIGIEASEWAVSHKISDQVLLGNVLEAKDLAIVNREYGPFGTVITEDLLPYLDDTEAITAAGNCSTLAPIVIHMVTVQGQADLNYHTLAEWVNLTGQLTFSLEGM